MYAKYPPLLPVEASVGAEFLWSADDLSPWKPVVIRCGTTTNACLLSRPKSNKDLFRSAGKRKAIVVSGRHSKSNAPL